MYAETGLLFPYFHFPQEIHQFDDLFHSQKSNASLNNLIQTSAVSEYDLGEEGDLFRAPEHIIEEPMISLDSLEAVSSVISCGEDVISSQGLKVSDIESFQTEQFLNDVFNECERDMLAHSSAAESSNPVSSVLDTKMPFLRIDDSLTERNELTCEDLIQKSVSSGCISPMEGVMLDTKMPFMKIDDGLIERIELLCEDLIQKSFSSGCVSSVEGFIGASVRSNFLDFPSIGFYGMRRAFSEGDIQTLGHNNTSLAPFHLEAPLVISTYTIEERRQKLTRYRNKKSKRNFGRKIKYACRKTLADSQPRIRGRFAKTEECDVSRKQ